MRVFFDRDLDTAATYWRIFRRDGFALGFTSHDRALVFGSITHRAAPGMVPAAIRMTSDLSEDSAGVEGALTHDAISDQELNAGLYDNAAIEIGIVDWETLEHHAIYSGTVGQIESDGRAFSSELRSAKRLLDQDLVPRTSPTCRAEFCGRGCGLSAHKYATRASVEAVDYDLNRVKFDNASGPSFLDGQVRFLSGPQTGLVFGVLGTSGTWMTLDRPIAQQLAIGTAAEVRQGCDHTLGTCAARFDNAVNFRGEPFLPGNDLLARYGQGQG